MIPRSYSIFLILFLSTGSILAQTTEEEYQYVTYGYKEQLLNGHDDKEGYQWKPITNYQFVEKSGILFWKKRKEHRFEFEGLYRIGERNPCAIVAIFKERINMEKKDGLFICIPHSKSFPNIIGKAESYFEEIGFGKANLQYYCLALGKLVGELSR